MTRHHAKCCKQFSAWAKSDSRLTYSGHDLAGCRIENRCDEMIGVKTAGNQLTVRHELHTQNTIVIDDPAQLSVGTVSSCAGVKIGITTNPAQAMGRKRTSRFMESSVSIVVERMTLLIVKRFALA